MSPKSLLSFLRFSRDIRNTKVVTFFCLFLSVCSRYLRGFDKGPVWVATGFMCSFDLPLFLLLPPLPLWAQSQPDGLGFWWPPACAPVGGEIRTASMHLCVISRYSTQNYCKLGDWEIMTFCWSVDVNVQDSMKTISKRFCSLESSNTIVIWQNTTAGAQSLWGAFSLFKQLETWTGTECY